MLFPDSTPEMLLSDFIAGMSDDLLIIICNFLHPRDILHLAETCKRVLYRFDCSEKINNAMISRVCSRELGINYNFRYIFAIYLRLGPAAIADIINNKSLCLSQMSISRLSPMVFFRDVRKVNISANKIANISAILPGHGFGIAGIASLWAADNFIADISPILWMKSLTSLNLSDNMISEIPDLSGLTALQSADFSRNMISRMSAWPTSLNNLILSCNAIADIDSLAGLTALVSLDISHNNLSDIRPIACAKSLEYLNVSDNNIADIGEIALCRLKVINVSGNPIKNISELFRAESIEYIYCWNTEVDFAKSRAIIAETGKKINLIY